MQISSITDNVEAGRSVSYTGVYPEPAAAGRRDGAGLRVKKVAGATTTRYIFSKQMGQKLLAEYVDGSLSKEYIHSESGLLATVSGGTTTFHHADNLSVRLSTDNSGALIGEQGHYPFGDSWYQSGTTTPFAFTSYYRDATLGLDYAINRYHSYRLGRFQTVDPLALLSTCPSPGVAHRLFDPQSQTPQHTNLYPYVANDPVNLTDPLGLFIREWDDGYYDTFDPIGPEWFQQFDSDPSAAFWLEDFLWGHATSWFGGPSPLSGFGLWGSEPEDCAKKFHNCTEHAWNEYQQCKLQAASVGGVLGGLAGVIVRGAEVGIVGGIIGGLWGGYIIGGATWCASSYDRRMEDCWADKAKCEGYKLSNAMAPWI